MNIARFLMFSCVIMSSCIFAQDTISHNFTKNTYRPHTNSICYPEKGSLKIRNVTNTEFDFIIDVGNATGASGSISGKASLYGPNTAHYRESLTEEEKAGDVFREADIYFHLSPGSDFIFVHAENTTAYHGMQVCFEGYYELIRY